MANHSPQRQPSQSATLILSVLIFSLSSSSLAADVPSSTTFLELESMLEAVRNHGYTLFTNAITTSDLHYKLLTSNRSAASAVDPPPFTLFAPTDETLFALDMASEAAAYVSTLHYHVVPDHRHTFADLQNLSSPFLDTLLPYYSVLVGTTRGLGNVSSAVVGVMVDGVRVSRPDLFIGPRIAVHGIDGILLTGLNMNQYLDGSENGSGIVFPPAGFPAPFSDGYIPAPVESPISGSEGNIPAEGSPLSDHFVWDVNAPAPAVAAPSVMLMDGAERMKVSGGKKAGKRRRRGHGHHRRHRKVTGSHHLDDF